MVRMRARVLFALSQLRLRGPTQLDCLGSRLEFLLLQWRDVYVFVWVGVGVLVCRCVCRGGGEVGESVLLVSSTNRERARQSSSENRRRRRPYRGSASHTGGRGKLSQKLSRARPHARARTHLFPEGRP